MLSPQNTVRWGIKSIMWFMRHRKIDLNIGGFDNSTHPEKVPWAGVREASSWQDQTQTFFQGTYLYFI